MKKKYFWKEISVDGLVKNPDKIGPDYDETDLNDGQGFDSEQEAIDHAEFTLRSEDFKPDLVLIAEYYF